MMGTDVLLDIEMAYRPRCKVTKSTLSSGQPETPCRLPQNVEQSGKFAWLCVTPDNAVVVGFIALRWNSSPDYPSTCYPHHLLNYQLTRSQPHALTSSSSINQKQSHFNSKFPLPLLVLSLLASSKRRGRKKYEKKLSSSFQSRQPSPCQLLPPLPLPLTHT